MCLYNRSVIFLKNKVAMGNQHKFINKYWETKMRKIGW